MRKIIAALNMTLDGICDHNAGVADEDLHNHYTELLNTGDAILYGRTTYQLMQYWQTLIDNPSGQKSMDDFAKAIDRIPKIVLSKTIVETGWHNARLASQELEKEVENLKMQTGNDIFVGSRSVIIQLLNLGMIDELQICIHPIAEGQGLPFFKDLQGRIMFTLRDTRVFDSGAIILYYQPRMK